MFREYMRNSWTMLDFVLICNELIEAQRDLVTLERVEGSSGKPVPFQEKVTIVVIARIFKD